MTDAEYTYMWLIVALTVGVILMGIGAALTGILPTRAKQAELDRDRQARDDKAYRFHADSEDAA